MTLPDEREAVAVAVAGGDAGDAVTAWHGLVEGLFVADARLEAATAPGMHATRTARVVVDDAASASSVRSTPVSWPRPGSANGWHGSSSTWSGC